MAVLVYAKHDNAHLNDVTAKTVTAAKAMGVPFLGRIPLDMAIRKASDAGTPPAAGNSPQARAFIDAFARLPADNRAWVALDALEAERDAVTLELEELIEEHGADDGPLDEAFASQSVTLRLADEIDIARAEETAPYVSMPGEAGTTPSRAVVLKRL